MKRLELKYVSMRCIGWARDHGGGGGRGEDGIPDVVGWWEQDGAVATFVKECLGRPNLDN